MDDLHIPLVVDLDGTLIHSDMLHESCVSVVRTKPLTLFSIPAWLVRGKAYLKGRLSQLYEFNPASLPYNLKVLEFLRAQKNAGRKILLCTAANQDIAKKIAAYLDIFDDVLATHEVNLAGKNKADRLVSLFKVGGFDYIGNSHADIDVWKKARLVYVANASTKAMKKIHQILDVHLVFESEPAKIQDYAQALRVHQWLKNLLIFIPMFAAHQLVDSQIWAQAILGFFAFSLCASAVYMLNDISDLESDRQHPRKCLRPFAAGVIGIDSGMILVILLVIGGLGLAKIVGIEFLVCLLVYLALTTAYTFGLKQLVLLDCIILAGLYTLRIIAGGIAVNLPSSFWLLAFSVFIFLSLAYVKRYAELDMQKRRGASDLSGRGYRVEDMPLVETLGVTSGFIAALVLALYLNSETIIALYHAPQIIWFAVPILLLWISYLWLKTHRGDMHDDPIIFAIEDRASLLIVFFLILSFVLAKFL